MQRTDGVSITLEISTVETASFERPDTSAIFSAAATVSSEGTSTSSPFTLYMSYALSFGGPCTSINLDRAASSFFSRLVHAFFFCILMERIIILLRI